MSTRAVDEVGQVPPVPAWASVGRRAWGALVSDWGARLTAYGLGVAVWQLLALAYDRVPGPAQVAEVLFDEATNGALVEHFSATAGRFLSGVAIAFVSGVALGVVLGLSPLARALVKDTLMVGLAIPAVIWALLTTMWFGFSWRAPVATVALTALPFVAVNVAQGVQGVPRDLLRMSRAFGVPRARRIRHVVLPAIVDYVFSGLRFGIILGWNGVLLSEWFGQADGVGWRTRWWYDANRFHGFVAWMVLFIVFIVLIDRLVLERVSRRILRWRTATARV